MARNACPICRTEAVVEDMGDPHIECPNCGVFNMTKQARASQVGKNFTAEEAAVLSHAIYQMQERQEGVLLDDTNIKAILSSKKVPGHVEQADNLIRFIGRELDRRRRPGGTIRRNYESLRAKVGSLHAADVQYIITELVSQGLASTVSAESPVGLTFDGWNRYRDITTQGSTARVAFMAMQYGEDELDKVFETCFRPAVEETGFELRRLDHHPKAGLIDDIMRLEIRNSRFVLADLTHSNRGSYWESGFAEGLGKPVIYMCKKSVFDGEGDEEKPHFDINHCHTVVWQENELEKCAAELKATIRVTLPGEAKQTDD